MNYSINPHKETLRETAPLKEGLIETILRVELPEDVSGVIRKNIADGFKRSLRVNRPKFLRIHRASLGPFGELKAKDYPSGK